MAEDAHYLEGPGGRLPSSIDRPGKELGWASPAAQNEEPDSEGLDLGGILQILWSRRYWIGGAGVLGLLAALIYALVQTPLYRSTVMIELNPPTVPILTGGEGDSESLVVPNTDQQFQATQLGILKSRNLAERVVEDLGLVRGGEGQQPEARVRSVAGELANNLEVAPQPGSRLVELTYSSPDPARAATIVNSFADSYMASTLDRHFEASAKAREFLKNRLESTRAALNESERKLVEYAKANDLISVPSGGGEGGQSTSGLSSASLGALNDALAQAQQRRIAAEGRFRQAGSITETSQSTAGLRGQKAELEAEYREKATYLQDDYPEMVRLRSRINALDNAIRQTAGTASGSLRAEYQAALSEENALRAKVSQLSAEVLDERERSIQYNMFQRELDTNRSLYDALLERYNEIGVGASIGSPLASIVDRGQVPGSPYTPNIPLSLALGLLVGLGLGAVVAYGYELISDTIKTPEDVREKLHLPVLGVIPQKKRKDVLAEQLADSKSPLSEGYSSLLTMLRFSTNAGMPRSMLITSVRPSEGKSTTSFALATMLARLGNSVLLIDADMRKPSFVVEERADLGLSRLLVTSDRTYNHVLRTRTENLSLLPSGPVPPNPAQLLNGPRMTQIMNELRQSFDYVIVDAPPTLGLADAPLLGIVCHSVLLIVESGKTRRRLALEAIGRLQGVGNLVLGAALTKYHSATGDYGYSYNYSYGEKQQLSGGKHELMIDMMGPEED